VGIAALYTLMPVGVRALTAAIFTAGTGLVRGVEVTRTTRDVTSPHILLENLLNTVVVIISVTVEFVSQTNLHVPRHHDDADNTSFDGHAEDTVKAMVHDGFLVRVSLEDKVQSAVPVLQSDKVDAINGNGNFVRLHPGYHCGVTLSRDTMHRQDLTEVGLDPCSLLSFG